MIFIKRVEKVLINQVSCYHQEVQDKLGLCIKLPDMSKTLKRVATNHWDIGFVCYCGIANQKYD